MKKRHITFPIDLSHSESGTNEVNSKRNRISHALLCGPYVQIFGTEKHCLKYFSVWVDIFPKLFSRGVRTEAHEITHF